ncbi:hypothetical protein GCM10009530_08520 [Microbispora corallina]|uniref:Polysaccharide chain length determinant N-terminal domain-containing protein n=1 Tax=Microbispora corallina TaxID=83302 RepID=A0ABQ4FVG6_9ACTN|nr:hypothetical protein [Microbispora corallina]GIH38815.1 hypothetical protein Mco01_18150 [Microbispora corallina]
MDFWATVLVLFRRWYVTFPVFALVLAGAAGVYVKFPKTYVSSSALALTVPRDGGSVPADPKFPNPVVNPIVNIDSGLGLSASILIQGLNTAEIAEKAGVRPGGRTTFKVSNGTTNPELMITVPFVVISSEAPTPQEAYDVVVRLNRLAQEKLVEQQRALGAPPATYLKALEVVPPTTPEEKTGSRLRAAFVALAMGLFLAMAAAFAVESMAQARRARREEPPLAVNGVPVPHGLRAAARPLLRR